MRWIYLKIVYSAWNSNVLVRILWEWNQVNQGLVLMTWSVRLTGLECFTKKLENALENLTPTHESFHISHLSNPRQVRSIQVVWYSWLESRHDSIHPNIPYKIVCNECIQHVSYQYIDNNSHCQIFIAIVNITNICLLFQRVNRFETAFAQIARDEPLHLQHATATRPILATKLSHCACNFPVVFWCLQACRNLIRLIVV